jgi:hypothetical protein
MSRLTLPSFAILFLAMVGCVTDQPKTEIVSSNPFGHPSSASPQSQTNQTPSSLDAAARVDQIGRRLMAANKAAGLQPLFRTIGAPQPEIFHRGTSEIDITEGLVKQCTSDGQLAAVLCTEMGKMVSEREALAASRLHALEQSTPADVPVGNDGGGLFGPADQLHRAEVAKFEQQHPRNRVATPPPDSKLLARTYLSAAGFAAADLDAVAPLLQAASENDSFARQLVTPPVQR